MKINEHLAWQAFFASFFLRKKWRLKSREYEGEYKYKTDSGKVKLMEECWKNKVAQWV